MVTAFLSWQLCVSFVFKKDVEFCHPDVSLLIVARELAEQVNKVKIFPFTSTLLVVHFILFQMEMLVQDLTIICGFQMEEEELEEEEREEEELEGGKTGGAVCRRFFKFPEIFWRKSDFFSRVVELNMRNHFS